MTSKGRSALLKIGTTFASLDEFKVAAYTAAVSSSSRLLISHPPSSYEPWIELRCLPLGHKASSIRWSKACSYHIRAVRMPSKVFTVVEANDRHTCGWGKDEQGLLRAEKQMQNVLTGLKRGIERTRAADLAGTNYGTQSGGAKKKPSPAAQKTPARPVQAPLTVTPRLEKKRPFSAVANEQKRADEVLKAAEQSARRLNKSNLKADYQRLAQTDSIDLPNPEQGFHSARNLLIHLYAYAAQHDLPWYHVQASDRIYFVCNRRTSTSCPFELAITEGEDGEWRLTTQNLVHSKKCQNARGDIEAEENNEGPPSATSPLFSNFSASRPPAHKPLQQLDHLRFIVPMSSSSDRIKNTSNLPLSDLTAFFTATIPSSQSSRASLALSAVSDTDLRTVSSLSQLLQFEESTVGNLIEASVEDGKLEEAEKVTLSEALNGARQACNAAVQ
ncbi:hypothetical protein JCM11641_006672 [Rhodosporidiobolus odoratus]